MYENGSDGRSIVLASEIQYLAVLPTGRALAPPARARPGRASQAKHCRAVTKDERIGTMRLQERHTLRGEVLSVDHSAKSCRIVVELKGSPEFTAAIMKKATVEMGLLAGAPVCAEIDATHIVLGVGHGDACALPG